MRASLLAGARQPGPRGLPLLRDVLLRMKAQPLVDVVAHATRYMVRCSSCGIIAVELNPTEAVAARDDHVCEKRG